MRRKLVPIYSVLAVAIVLLAVLVPSCGGGGGGGGGTGTIDVNAVLCGNPWTGNVSYTLTGPSTINGNNVSASFGVPTGNWTCAYISGGPDGAFLVDITPSATQTVSKDQTTTFVLNFELDQDAGITGIDVTRNGAYVPGDNISDGVVCNIIGAEFLQWVDGCAQYNVTANETSWLNITQVAGPPATIYVVNDTCAVDKTPNFVGPPPTKVFQVPTIGNYTVGPGDYITLVPEAPSELLNAETQWQLIKDTYYTTSINWFGISKAPFVFPGPHPCVLFELVVPVLPQPQQYVFTLVTSTEVDLVGATDVNLTNNHDMSPPLTLVVNVPAGP
ncbi:MAG: hypothetical protein MUO80_07115 [Dehalococcoidia bacterium]|nr:hypothetical protein [Dehalococcoidia bacterium]